MPGTIVLLLLLAILAVYALRSYRKRLSSGCCGAGDAQKVARVAVGDTDVSHYPYRCVLRIEGMHCENCARRIENAFNSREGMLAHVSVARGCAEVWGKAPLEDGTLRQIVALAGYHVTGIDRA